MAEREFLEENARRRTTAAVRAVEVTTSMELVVAARSRAGWHAGTSAALGLVFALSTLAVMWWSPTPYDVATMPLDALVAFVLGASLSATVPFVRRALTPRAFLRSAAERAARRAFASLGVEKTRERTGCLVHVALFERTVVFLPDVGLPRELVDVGFRDARLALEESVKRLDFAAFLGALAALGPPAQRHLPRRPDDENELCDDVA